jgi:hypothetical protein
MSSEQKPSHDESEHGSTQPAMQKHAFNASDFGAWWNEYTAADGNNLSKDSTLVQALNSDELDAAFVEQQVKKRAPKDPATGGFCAKCRGLFEDWPTLGDSSTRDHDSEPDPDQKGWEHATAVSYSTFELEGSAHSGCRFCSFLLQNLKDSKALDTYRKIEARLYALDKPQLSSLSIQNWGTNPSQLLWLNLPGKVCTSCNDGIALDVKFDSVFLPASGASCSFAHVLLEYC